MAVTVDAYGSRHWLGFEAGNGLHVHVLTGLVIISFRGEGSLSWVHDTLTFEVPLPDLPAGQGLKVVQWAPYVAWHRLPTKGPR